MLGFLFGSCYSAHTYVTLLSFWIGRFQLFIEEMRTSVCWQLGDGGNTMGSSGCSPQITVCWWGWFYLQGVDFYDLGNSVFKEQGRATRERQDASDEAVQKHSYYQAYYPYANFHKEFISLPF